MDPLPPNPKPQTLNPKHLGKECGWTTPGVEPCMEPVGEVGGFYLEGHGRKWKLQYFFGLKVYGLGLRSGGLSKQVNNWDEWGYYMVYRGYRPTY